MGNGRFITFEGTEGGGKSTQIQILADRLKAQGHSVLTLREPGGTPLAEELRFVLKHSENGKGMCPETELLLINACRAQLVREVIRPALAKKQIVLCDRFYDSTIAYQAYGRELPLEQVQATIEFAVNETKPDLTFLLHVSIEVSEARRVARSKLEEGLRDRFEEADRAFFQRVEQGFIKLAESDPERIKKIDASRDVDEVANQIWRFVSSDN
jgi:dTMP kinase